MHRELRHAGRNDVRAEPQLAESSSLAGRGRHGLGRLVRERGKRNGVGDGDAVRPDDRLLPMKAPVSSVTSPLRTKIPDHEARHVGDEAVSLFLGHGVYTVHDRRVRQSLDRRYALSRSRSRVIGSWPQR